ncbi:purine nucleoside permease-domain-containing protein [Amylocarpus encephaloides]|uniref:Purine nucleoside permease-domain-containing protein n=1 Tax=Amylocarpus encephaloides TaxID=45428 RepID=A0A9P8C7C9_9HELO|nr:purine nucleoside permease-domain-containing protein [Amylocarpus encephaloides]
MQLRIFLGALWWAFTCLAACQKKRSIHASRLATESAPQDPRSKVVAPKVFIITMFPPEADPWLKNSGNPNGIGSLLDMNITIPGASPLFPQAHCLASGTVCLMTIGEGEINAASTMTALLLSHLFDLTKTYFLITGIAGVNPNHGTLSDVAFAKYAVQIGLQYEFDAREVPGDWRTGYVPLGAKHPDLYPTSLYGTEVFELNANLRDAAYDFAVGAAMNDSGISVDYRQNYNTATAGSASRFKAALRTPGVIKGDVVTSDVYFSGTLLGESIEKFVTLITNGSAVYTMTAQEDNATLNSLLRAAMLDLVDFSRVIIMRGAADFDRPYPGSSCLDNLFGIKQGAFDPSIRNLYTSGMMVVRGILGEWEGRYERGVEAKNYIGDLWGNLGGKPDFGPGRQHSDNPVQERGLDGDTDSETRNHSILEWVGYKSLVRGLAFNTLSLGMVLILN